MTANAVHSLSGRSRATVHTHNPQVLGAVEERLISSALAIAMCVLVYTGLVDFVSWSQVDILWAFRLPPSAITDHPHYYRYLVVYPGFLLGDYGLSNAFSLYVAAFMVGGQLLIRAMILPTSRVFAIAAQLAYISVHFFMNGRGAIAWAAWTLAIYAINDAELYGWRVRHGFITASAILGSTVSSGALLVVYATSLAVLVYCLAVPGKRRGAFILLPGVAYFSTYLLVSIDKNLTFFQVGNTNAVLNMLGHGWGRLLEQSRAFIFFAFLLIITIPFIVHYYMSRYSPVKLATMFAPIGGGIFGVTTLTLFIPSLLATVLDRRGRNSP